MKRKPTNKEQMIAGTILEEFMGADNLKEFNTIWGEQYMKYDLQRNPFNGCICTTRQYRKLMRRTKK